MNTRNKVHAAKTIESEVVKTERLQGLLELQRINAATLVRRIESQHSVPLVASMSPALMTLESTIMLQICMKFALQGSIIGERELSEAEQLEVFGELKPEARTGTPFGKPVLPIHDAVLCKESEIDFAEQTMMDVYHEIMGFNPVIKREF